MRKSGVLLVFLLNFRPLFGDGLSTPTQYWMSANIEYSAVIQYIESEDEGDLRSANLLGASLNSFSIRDDRQRGFVFLNSYLFALPSGDLDVGIYQVSDVFINITMSPGIGGILSIDYFADLHFGIGPSLSFTHMNSDSFSLTECCLGFDVVLGTFLNLSERMYLNLGFHGGYDFLQWRFTKRPSESDNHFTEGFSRIRMNPYFGIGFKTRQHLSSP